MASDSEGLRLYYYFFVHFLPPFLLKMASDSEGLRQCFLSFRKNRFYFFVENGFRFGRVTTYLFILVFVDFFENVENGFRFGRVTTGLRPPPKKSCGAG